MTARAPCSPSLAARMSSGRRMSRSEESTAEPHVPGVAGISGDDDASVQLDGHPARDKLVRTVSVETLPSPENEASGSPGAAAAGGALTASAAPAAARGAP